MKAFSLHGPLAHYQRTVTEQAARIEELCAAAARAQANAAQQEQLLARERQRVQELEHCRVPELQNQLAGLQGIIEELSAQVEAERDAQASAACTAAAGVAALQSKLEAALADNAVLRAELQKSVHLRAACAAKVEAARKHLGMTQPEADVFIKDLDQLRAANKDLAKQVAALTADKARLEQQCDSRSAHALTLITENKRLLQQVAELRKQASAVDQQLWQAKQELAVAEKKGARIAQRRSGLRADQEDRPPWQGLASHSAEREAGGPANRMFGKDVSNTGADQGTAQAAAGAAHTKAGHVKPKTKAPMSQAAATLAAVQQAAARLDELRKGAVQQALASRQTRLEASAAAMPKPAMG